MSQAPELMGVKMSNLFWLAEAKMAWLRPFLPKSDGVPRVDECSSSAQDGQQPALRRRNGLCGDTGGKQ